MKKFVNDPQQFVPEMLKGVELANPGTLRYVPDYNLIMRADAPREDKVSIIQGSGSGHEPAHVMIVGKGMLDAACPGDVFAAPPSDYVYETTKLLASPKGVLHIINNYTGDKMAFDMGKELAEADDVKIATLVVGHTVVMLEDGTALLLTVKPKAVRALLGQKDGEGRQAYELDNEMLIANITPPKT